MQTVEIPFGEWLPDVPDYKNPGCLTANNVIPSPGGYGPFLGAVAQGDSTAGTCLGAKHLFRTTGAAIVVGGTGTSLFSIVGGTLAATTGLTDIGADAYWSIAQFNAFVIAAGPNNNIKALTDIDSDTTWSDLAGSPPQAKVVARVGNFLMAANLPSLPFSFQNSALNSPTDWPTPGTADARQKSSGRGNLQFEYGEITGIAGDRYAMMFQQRAVSRIDFVGPPQVFQITPIEEARGCIAPQSIITVGFMTYFLAHDGFWATDGNQTFPIGTSKVNRWFFDNVSETDRFRTQGAIIWEKECIIWSFYPADNATGFNRQIIFSWAQNKWSTANLPVDWIVDNKVGATTLEDLDALFATLEDVTPNLDSSFWGARSRVLSAFIQDGAGNTEINLLNGTALEAEFETSDTEPKPGNRVAVKRIYPMVENADINTTAALVTREQKGGAPMTTAFAPINNAGFCPVNGSGRFVRTRTVIPAAASWDRAQGVMAAFRVTGMR